MIKARQFYVTLTEVLKCACKDETLPSICAVKFVVKNGAMFIMATDRYRIAVGKIPGTDLEDGQWVAGRGDVSALLGTLRAHKIGSTKSDKTLIDIEAGETWKVTAQNGTELTMRADWAADFPKLSGHFPNDWEEGVTVDGAQIGADKNYVYSFDTAHDGKPQLFRSKPGAEFEVTGVLMPLRDTHGDETWKRSAEMRDHLEGQ